MRIFLLLIAIISLSSCATMMDGGKTRIHIYDGKPSAAGVYYNGDFIGYTPCVVYAKKKSAKKGNSVIEIRKTGYTSETIDLTRKAQTGYLIADIILAVIPLFVDLANANLYKVQPEEIKYVLTKGD